MGKIIGIDLGTTNSCVAVLEGGEPVVIPSAEGQRTIPSVIAFTEKGEALAGQVAKNQMITNPENTLRSVKRFIGRRYEECSAEIKLVPYKVKTGPNNSVLFETREKDFRPEEISARILRSARARRNEKILRPYPRQKGEACLRKGPLQALKPR